MMSRFRTLAFCAYCLCGSLIAVCADEMLIRADPSSGNSAATRGFQVVPYGALWGNMLYASQRVFPGEFTLFVFSAEDQPESALTTDARRSRLGLRIAGPPLLDGHVRSQGRIEIDFLGEFVDANQPQARLRHVYWEAVSERHRFLIGQTWDVMSPLLPHTLNFSAGWFGGNVGFRRAQFRYEHHRASSPQRLHKLQLSLNQDISPDFPTDEGVRRETSNYPVAEGRVATVWNPW